MALDPNGGGPPNSGGLGGPPGVPPPWYTKNPGAMLDSYVNPIPSINIPNYQDLLAQFMAPYQSLFSQQMAAMSSNIQRQMQYARQQEALAEKQLGIAKDRLTQQHGISVQNIANTLTARGLADSGETKYQNFNENKSYNQGLDSIANQIEQLKTSLANTLAGLEFALQQQQYAGALGLLQQQNAALPYIQAQNPVTVTPNPPRAVFGTLGPLSPLPPVPASPRVNPGMM